MDDYLAHHGIKGMKWGVRRFQNEDGSYTSKGKSRLKTTRKKRHKLTKAQKQMLTELGVSAGLGAASLGAVYGYNKYMDKQYEKQRAERQKYYDEYRKRYSDFWNDYYKTYSENDHWQRKSNSGYNQNSYNRNSYNRNRYSGYSNYGQKQNTSKTKSTDREAKYKNSKIDYKTAKAKVDTMKKKVAKAQAEGNLTADMVEELQEAMAQYKVAARQAQHSIWVINADRNYLAHSGLYGNVWTINHRRSSRVVYDSII